MPQVAVALTIYSAMKITRYIIAIMLIATHAVAWAATDMGEVWEAIPQKLVPTIEPNRRMDMIDLYHAGQPARAATLLGGEAEITAMGDNYIAVRLSTSSTLQIKRIKTAKETIYVTIHTLYAPAANSRIEIYDSRWQPLDTHRYLPEIKTDDFVASSVDKAQRREILTAVLIPTIEYTMNEASDDIAANATFEQTLDADTYRSIAPDLLLHRTLQWNGSRWQLIAVE